MRLRVALLKATAILAGVALLALPVLGGSERAPNATATPEAATLVTAPAEDATPAATPPPTPQPPEPRVPATPDPAPAVTPAPPEPSGTPEASEPPQPPDLRARLAALVAAAGLNAGASVGVVVLDESGAPVFESGADAALLPASTLKLFVAAAAMARLGGDFRYTTEVAGSGPLDTEGVLHGDVVLLGGADPALASPDFAEHVNPQRPRTPLESLADQVVAAGVRRVAGGVVGDESVLPREPQAAGWLPRYLTRGDTTRSSGLTVNAGRRLFTEGGRWRSLPADDPAVEAAAALHALLVERGVAIDGGVGTVAARPTSGVMLGSVESPPLLELLRYTVQRSDNHLADAIFRTLGLADGDATWAGAARATVAALAPLGIDLSGLVLADGSGLSRDDRATPRSLALLDARMTTSTLAAEWRSLQAVSGESGTLRRRLVGTVAEGRLAGKTGSLQDVRSLSGAVHGPEGTRYHFAVLGNGLDEAGRDVLRALADEVVLALAEDLYGCVLVPIADPSPEPSAAPTASPEASASTPAEGAAAPASSPEPEPELELVCAA